MERMLKGDYEQYIHASRYARWMDHSGRRETWHETVWRYLNFWVDRGQLTDKDALMIFPYIADTKVMPSMRCMMTAGTALTKDNVAGYNCSYLALDNPIAFDEAMYVLMCGTGVGFSCERQYVSQLPVVMLPDERAAILRDEWDNDDPDIMQLLDSLDNTWLFTLYEPEKFKGVHPHELSSLDGNVIRVADSKYGWASALRILLCNLWNANFDIEWDVSQIRPAGARLQTFGGRASGPEPLVQLFKFAVAMFKEANGRKLSSIECHDLMCKVADVVVVGGVRRSALISLSNLTDRRMAKAKSGEWWNDDPQRALANNSIAYTERPDMDAFMQEWYNLYGSKSGERGVFNRIAAEVQAARNGRRSTYLHYGTNPCSEIILRNKQFCNLSEVVVREDDTVETLADKVWVATILGTLQASLTDFVYLSDEWRVNTETEALLGVSLTGIEDNALLNGSTGLISLPIVLEELKGVAIDTNKSWADKLGINQSAAITCVKPSGTVSQLVDSASGIHPRYARYYIRSVRQDNKDPITQFLKDQGVPYEPCVMKPDSTTVFYFPKSAPESATLRDDRSAIDQLELWKVYQEYWCEHKPSITVYVREHEWMEVGAWVWKHFDTVSGVSFLPHSNHTYQQAPYQEIDEATYRQMVKDMPVIDWSKLAGYETEDFMEGVKTFACTGGVCEI